MVHAYSLAIPGVSTGQNFKSFVYKTYNYMFTGDNVDVLDLNINYKYAYFQSRLKDVDASDGRQNKIEKTASEPTGSISNPKPVYDDNLTLKSEVTISQVKWHRENGKIFHTGGPVHRRADTPHGGHGEHQDGDTGRSSMAGTVTVHTGKSRGAGTGASSDKDIGYWRNNLEAIWDSKRRCYNADLAEPISDVEFQDAD